MKLLSLMLILAFISPLNYAIDVENNSTYENACRYNINGLIYVHIEGEPYERGYQHGYLLYAEIADMIYRWSNIIHNCPVIIKYLPIDQNSTKYEELSKRWWDECKKLSMKIFWPYYPDEYRKEIKGIADGARARGVEIYGEPITYEDVLTLNEMYELMSILVNPTKSFHMLKDVFHSLASVFPSLDGKEIEFAAAFYPVHHCNGFAAVGNATTDEKIVISDAVWCGGWWYSYYIAQRWNVILDIEPSDGHRLIIATSPGYIWSDEDYWQNDVGLAMIETTFIQGVYKLKGLPLAIRARMAIQYGDTIDDVIRYLLTENTGVMNAQWLIADAEANEIALLEFGLYHYNVIRKNNGFLWSANNPFDFWVRRDILGYEILKAPIFRLAHLLLNTSGYQYYTLFYTPSERDIKFEELGKEYYGKIDAEVVKKIMTTPPITDFTTDCKITDGNMIFNNTLWAFWGNPTYVWNTSSLSKLKGVRDVPPAGWVKIYGVPYDFKPDYEKGNMGRGRDARLLWSYEIGGMNHQHATMFSDGENAYALYNSTIYAMDVNGSILWQKNFNEKIEDVYVGDKIYVATVAASYAFSKDGKQVWNGRGGNVIAGNDGKVYVADENSVYGEKRIFPRSVDDIFCHNGLYIVEKNRLIGPKWNFTAGGKIMDVDFGRDVYVGSADGCLYCIDDGSLKWKFTAGWCISDVESDDGRIYASSYDGNVYCLDEEGNKIWTFSSNGSINDIEEYGSMIYASSTDGRLYAINRSSGEAEFSFAPAHEIEGLYNYITTPLSSIVALSGKIFVSAAGSIYCLDAETFEKEEERNGGIAGGPFVLGLAVLIFLLLIFAVVYMKYRKKE